MSSYAVITKTLHRTRPGADHTARFVRRPGGSSANRHRHISRTQTSGPHRGASLSAHNFKAARDPPAIPSLVGNWWLLLLPGADRWVAPPSPALRHRKVCIAAKIEAVIAASDEATSTCASPLVRPCRIPRIGTSTFHGFTLRGLRRRKRLVTHSFRPRNTQ